MGQSPRSRWEGQPLLSGMWNEGRRLTPSKAATWGVLVQC